MSRRFVASALLLLSSSARERPWRQEVRLDPGRPRRRARPSPWRWSPSPRRPARLPRSVTAVGTVLATRSVTLRNELAGTVRTVALVPGRRPRRHGAGRPRRLGGAGGAAGPEGARRPGRDPAPAQPAGQRRPRRLRRRGGPRPRRADVALAEVERTEGHRPQDDPRPFRPASAWPTCIPASTSNEGTVLTTLQGIDDVAHVDFAVPQRVAAGLHAGDRVGHLRRRRPVTPRTVAVDARWIPPAMPPCAPGSRTPRTPRRPVPRLRSSDGPGALPWPSR